MLTRMLQRRGTAAQWLDVANSVILAPGEIGLETDTGKFKVGNGTTVWASLSYYLRDSDNDDIYSKLTATQTFTGSQVVTPANASTVPLVVAGTTGQSAYLQSWRDVSGNALAYVNPAGMITATGGNFTANVEMNNHSISGLKDIDGSSTDSYAVNKKYVDEAIAGLAWKAPVNLISASGLDTWVNVPITGNTGTLVLDGHTALDQTDTGYRLLLVNQSTASNNGIWLYTDNGTTYTLTRPVDSDTVEELRGASVFIQEGTHYGTSSWVQTDHYLSSFSNQVWVQFNGASQINAGDGLTKLGNTINAVAGQGLTANADNIQVTNLGIETGMLADDAVTNAKLADNAVENANIANDAVDTLEIKDGAITSAKIANGAIVNNDINAGAAIAQTKIASTLGNANIQEDLQEILSTAPSSIDDLGDVNIVLPEPGQALTYTDANGGEWINATPASTLEDLTDVDLTDPQDKQTLQYEAATAQWKNKVASGGVRVSATPPADPIAGDAWFDSVEGGLYVWYADGSSNQWVEIQVDSAFGASLEPRLLALETEDSTNNVKKNTSNIIISPLAASVPVTIKGAVSQSANMQEWKDSNNTTLSSIDQYGNGHFALAPSGSSFGLAVGTNGNPDVGGIVVQGTASQSANLQEFRNSSGAIIAFVSSSGTIQTNNVFIPITTAASDSIVLNFAGDTGLVSRTAAGAIAFSATNYTAGSIKTVRIVAGASARALSFPASW